MISKLENAIVGSEELKSKDEIVQFMKFLTLLTMSTGSRGCVAIRWSGVGEALVKSPTSFRKP